jgi:hypothetical protein
MKKLLTRGLLAIAALAVPAGAALALPAAANAATAHDSVQGGTWTVTTSNTGSTIYGDTINSNLDVPAGVTFFTSSHVTGNLTVEGTLYAVGGTFDKNVNVNPGGMFQGMNWGVTIKGNLNILDPAANSQNGFSGDEYGTSSLVMGNVNYKIDSLTAYPNYQSPQLYLYNTTVKGNLNYIDQGIGFPGHLDNWAAVQGATSISGNTPIA